MAFKRSVAGSAAMAVVLGVANPAYSQESADATDGVEEIVVTAQKRAQTIQNVPAAVSAFSAGAIEDRGIASMADLAVQLPGVKFGEFSATGTVTVRGVGTTIVSGAGENSVAVHIDGMFLSQPAALTMVQGDLGSVEVLRGPQGTLYGRNATAGVVNFISAQPSDALTYGLTAGAGNYERRYLNGYVSGALRENVRARLYLSYDERGGYAENTVTGQELDDLESLGGRLAFDVDFSPAWTSQFRIFAQRDAFAGPIYDGFDPSFSILPAPLVDFDPRRVASSVIYDSSKELLGGVMRHELDLGGARLTSITGYTDFTYAGRFDGIGAVLPVFLDRRLDARTFSHEFNLSREWDGGSWLAGFYFLNDRIKGISTTDFSALYGVPAIQFVNQNSQRNSVSVFADATFDLSERWSVFGGARLLHDDLRQELVNVTTMMGFPIVNCGAEPRQEDDGLSVTGRLGAQYRASDNVRLYGQISRGYKPGGFSQSTCDNPFDAETVDAVEFGYRGSWNRGRLIFNATAFYYANRNLQLEQATPSGIPVVNAPKSHVLGLEAELFWRPTDALRLDASLTLLDSAYDEFINQDPLLGAPPGASLEGVRLNGAPEFSATLGLEYAFDLQAAGMLTLRGEIYHSSEYNLREFDLPWTIQDAYTQFNAYAFWDSADGGVRIRGYVKNLTDEDVLGGVLGFGGAIGSYLPPRTFGIEITLSGG